MSSVEENLPEVCPMLHQLKVKAQEKRTDLMEMLERPENIINWERVREESFTVENGQLLANSLISDALDSAVPMLREFQSFIADLRIRTLMFLYQMRNRECIVLLGEPEHLWRNHLSGGAASTITTKLLIVLDTIKHMFTWTWGVFDTWVAYHEKRQHLGSTENLSQMRHLDRGMAVASWDYWMAGNIKSILNHVLYFYILIEDMLYRAELVVSRNQTDTSTINPSNFTYT